MKFIPRDPQPKPEHSPSTPAAPVTPVAPVTTTTRFLRLTPAPDVPPAASLPAPQDVPPPAESIPEPSPAVDSQPEPGLTASSTSYNSPVRPASKRLPNVFASAPSAQWTIPSASPTSSQALRHISISEIIARSETSALPAKPASPEPAPALEPEPAHELEHEEPAPASEPEAYESETYESGPVVEEIPSTPESDPAPATIYKRLAEPTRLVPPNRLNAQPVPLSRLTGTERSSLGRGFWILLVVLMVALVLLLYFFGFTPRLAANQELDREQKLSTQRVVVYGVARLATPKIELPLPGTVEAFQQAALCARTTGYVKRWLVDIGDVVKQGQLLAELDTPEVDQQLVQARSTADQAQSTLTIAQSAADRWTTMAKAHAVSQEDADQKVAACTVAQAGFSAAQASLARLNDLENFKEIRAPFPGKITYRNIEVGSLVTAGAASPNSELFRVSQTDPMRVFVEVPEANAPTIKPGVPAKLEVTSYPGRDFQGEVVRDAGSLNPASHTLRTEIRVANPDGALLPGAYANVRLQFLDNAPAILIPANSLIVNAAGTSVALVMTDNGREVVRYTSVRVGRDFGTEVEILENVKEGDRLVVNPPADLDDGTAVTAKPFEQPAAPSAVPRNPPAPKA